MEGITLTTIEQALVGIPSQLEASDNCLAQLRSKLAEQQDALEVARTNAALNAPDAINEAGRKLNRDKAISEDSLVLFSKKSIADTAFKIAEGEAHNAALRRQFAAHCHLAELRSAQLYLQAKGASKHD